MIIVYLKDMSFFGRLSVLLIVSVALITASGCSPGDSSQVDEEKEPHFVLGNSRCNEMDWQGAIEAFQESLEVNPHSAEAHYRLAVLYDTESPDPAAAIYHYQQYLKLEPDAKNRDVIGQRIHSCKMQLASDVCGLPDAPAVQKQMDSMVETNRELQAEVDRLNGQLRDWSAYYTSLKTAGIIGANGGAAASGGNNNSAAGSPALAVGASPTPDDISQDAGQQGGSQPAPSAQGQFTTTPRSIKTVATSKPARAHTHIVASGETMAAIARKHGLNIYTLEEANPGINPKKLHVGQAINLPQ